MAPVALARWESHKLECLADFIHRYDGAAKAEMCYLDVFARPEAAAGHGAAEGIELRVLDDPSLFWRYIFVVKTTAEAELLTAQASSRQPAADARIVTGNPMREAVLQAVFAAIPRTSASFALLEPRGYSALRWSVVRKLAAHGVDWLGHKPELLIIFPLEMALLRNLTRPECQNSINRLFGSDSWQAVKERKAQAESSAEEVRRDLIQLFCTNLKGLGYKYVEDAEPARFTNPPYYQVIWASDRASRADLLKEVWSAERFLPGEMFHGGADAG